MTLHVPTGNRRIFSKCRKMSGGELALRITAAVMEELPVALASIRSPSREEIWLVRASRTWSGQMLGKSLA